MQKLILFLDKNFEWQDLNSILCIRSDFQFKT